MGCGVSFKILCHVGSSEDNNKGRNRRPAEVTPRKKTSEIRRATADFILSLTTGQSERALTQKIGPSPLGV